MRSMRICLNRTVNQAQSSAVVYDSLVDGPETVHANQPQPSLLCQRALPGCCIMLDNTHKLFTGLWAQEETEVGKK